MELTAVLAVLADPIKSGGGITGFFAYPAFASEEASLPSRSLNIESRADIERETASLPAAGSKEVRVSGRCKLGPGCGRPIRPEF